MSRRARERLRPASAPTMVMKVRSISPHAPEIAHDATRLWRVGARHVPIESPPRTDDADRDDGVGADRLARSAPAAAPLAYRQARRLGAYDDAGNVRRRRATRAPEGTYVRSWSGID